MDFFKIWLCLLPISAASAFTVTEELKKPTVCVSILVRNKAHTLPYFLSNFERFDYPKDRISLWIYSDHNSDNSVEILKTWIQSVKDAYHSIQTEFYDTEKKYPGEKGPADWTEERFKNVINLRESALNHARNRWADYFLTIDGDVFLTNPDVITYLTSRNLTVVSPMLRTDSLYSNFWHGMTEDYYYQRTDQYKPVLYRETTGCFEVPMTHSCVLVDLRRVKSDLLTYVPERVPSYDGPVDDIIVFAMSANRSGIRLNVCNEFEFGYVTVPLEPTDGIELDYEQLTNVKMEVLNRGVPLYVNDRLNKYVKSIEKDTLGFDKIFMINLVRRNDRRTRMEHCFDELGLDVVTVDAVDGRNLNEDSLKKIKFLPEYVDPYHKRPMTLGEIGCFLSHYKIWEMIVENKYLTTLVLEDDIRFEPFFKVKVRNVMEEVNKISDWDLVYFGRKRLQDQDEPWVDNSSLLVHVGYSYWTLGYAISLRGAQKLLRAEPLSKLIPVDEYLPILFDRHPQEDWKEHFPKRDLVAFSAAPLLLFPTHYTGEKGYISDTEDSRIIKDVLREDL